MINGAQQTIPAPTVFFSARWMACPGTISVFGVTMWHLRPSGFAKLSGRAQHSVEAFIC